MYCFVILLLFNEIQMSVRRFSAIPHLRGRDLVRVAVGRVFPFLYSPPYLVASLRSGRLRLPVSLEHHVCFYGRFLSSA